MWPHYIPEVGQPCFISLVCSTQMGCGPTGKKLRLLNLFARPGVTPLHETLSHICEFLGCCQLVITFHLQCCSVSRIFPFLTACRSWQHSTLHYTTLHYTTLHCTALPTAHFRILHLSARVLLLIVSELLNLTYGAQLIIGATTQVHHVNTLAGFMNPACRLVNNFYKIPFILILPLLLSHPRAFPSTLPTQSQSHITTDN
jgi:hypothetical protein